MSVTLTTTGTTTAPVETERAIATLVLAFADDPILRWLFPDASRYTEAFPSVLRLLGDGATPHGTVDLVEDGAGAAIWHRPGTTSDDEALAGLVSAHVDARRQPDVFTLLERMDHHHPDRDTVWYLPFVGVDPTQQGNGHGSTLLRRGLERADRDQLPAYLEASSPRNRALYERHGFQVLSEVRVADSPPLWPMLRDPREPHEVV